jgi:hypothetical protein
MEVPLLQGIEKPLEPEIERDDQDDLSAGEKDEECRERHGPPSLLAAPVRQGKAGELAEKDEPVA